MGTETLLAVLAFGSMGAVIVFGYISVQRTEARRKSNTKRSTLAADAPNDTAPGERPVDV